MLPRLYRLGTYCFVVGLVAGLLHTNWWGSMFDAVGVPASPKQIVMVPPELIPMNPPPVYIRPTSSVTCLAQNLYYEAAHEPEMGLQAVAATVFNRMSSGQWPASVCGVVYQYRQYSWTLKPHLWPSTPARQYMQMATTFLRDRVAIQRLYQVTHYHRIDISPKWVATLTYVGTYGQHMFYN